MKKSKMYYVLSLTLLFSLLSGMTLHAFALSPEKSDETDTQEEVILIMDHQVENPPQDAEHIYRYSDGRNGYIYVKEVMDTCAPQEQILEEAATEVFLTPVQIDETTYEYLDEEGNVAVTLKIVTEADTAVPLSATKYGFHWRVEGESYTHGDVDLDVSHGTANLHVSMLNAKHTITYVGFYSAIANTYYWIEPPLSSDFTNYYFGVESSHPINFAIKNTAKDTNTYTGNYWLT